MNNLDQRIVEEHCLEIRIERYKINFSFFCVQMKSIVKDLNLLIITRYNTNKMNYILSLNKLFIFLRFDQDYLNMSYSCNA